MYYTNGFHLEPHTDHIKAHAYGSTPEDMVTHAVQSLWAVMDPTYADHDMTHWVPLSVYAPNVTDLVVNVLSKIVTYSNTRDIAYTHLRITELTHTRCVASIAGYPISQRAGTEIKGVTYHDASVDYDNGTWHARVTYDV